MCGGWIDQEVSHFNKRNGGRSLVGALRQVAKLYAMDGVPDYKPIWTKTRQRWKSLAQLLEPTCPASSEERVGFGALENTHTIVIDHCGRFYQGRQALSEPEHDEQMRVNTMLDLDV